MPDKNTITIYHGSRELVEFPEIRTAKYNKDFYFGFYCTVIKEQAERWAKRFGEAGYVNIYEYTPDEKLKTLKFESMTEEWLDFIVQCRSGVSHDYDIVEGPMADDTYQLRAGIYRQKNIARGFLGAGKIQISHSSDKLSHCQSLTDA